MYGVWSRYPEHAVTYYRFSGEELTAASIPRDAARNEVPPIPLYGLGPIDDAGLEPTPRRMPNAEMPGGECLWCPGDLRLSVEAVRCEPSLRAAYEQRHATDWGRLLPANAPIDQCFDITVPTSVILRWRDDDGHWMIVDVDHAFPKPGIWSDFLERRPNRSP